MLQCEEGDGEALHLDFERVDFAVSRDDGVGLFLVLREERLDGEIDESLRALRHLEQPLLQRRELLMKVTESSGFGGTHPNLPVI